MRRVLEWTEFTVIAGLQIALFAWAIASLLGVEI